MKKHCLSFTTASSLAVLIAMSAQALAQETGAADELVVTAERRAVSLQKAPVSISAFDQDGLDASGVQSTMDLQTRVPGLNIKNNSVLGQPYIRGIGTDIISAGADASVAVFVDDVYQARASSSIQELFDVERVEVVKGPQSTLYGRNVTGGSIRVFSKKPQPEYQAAADILYGNYDRLRVRGMVNAPIAGDKAMLRISAVRVTRDGYTDNLYNGKTLDDEDFWSVRGQLLLQPSEDLEIHIIGDVSREDSSRFLANKPEVGCCASLGLSFGGLVSDDPREVYHDSQDYAKVDTNGVTGKIEYSLEDFTITSVTGYRQSKFAQLLDLDATDVAAATNAPNEKSDTITQDLQFASNGEGPFSWIVGFYYLHEDVSQQLNIAIPLFAVTDTPGGDVETNAYAGYGQFSYQLSSMIKATAGVRYSHEKRSIVYDEVLTDPFGALTGSPGVINVAFADEETWSSWTPKFGLEFQPTDDALIYASVTRGFKAGGFNTSSAQPSFEPESLWAYELGWKTSWFDNRVRLNGAAFYYDYKDIQQLTLPPGAPVGTYPIVINAAKAKVKGLELELLAQVTEGFSVDASVLALDAEFDEFDSVDPNNPLGNTDRSGQRMPQAPEISTFVGAQYDWAIAGAGAITLRGEWSYQSSVYFNSFADPVVGEDGYSVFNGRLSFEAENSRWRAALFARNIGDKLYARNKIRQDPLVGNLINWAAPRTYGVEFGVSF